MTTLFSENQAKMQSSLDSEILSVVIDEDVQEQMVVMQTHQYPTYGTRISSLNSIAAEIIEEDSEMTSTKDDPHNEGNTEKIYPATHTKMYNGNGQLASRSGSVRDVYKRKRKVKQRKKQVDLNKWISQDPKNGFIRVFTPENDKESTLVNCTMDMTAMVICQKLGIPRHALHVQYSGGKLLRLDPFTCPLSLQNSFLASMGYADQRRIQKVGTSIELSYLIKFIRGKPSHDFTFTRNSLQGIIEVKKTGILESWERRFCDCSGTRLQVYKGTSKTGAPVMVFYLAKGDVQILTTSKTHDFKLRVSGQVKGGERSIHLGFKSSEEMDRWLRQLKKATSKQPSSTDLSNNHLETIPEPVFAYREIQILNLRHNCLRSRSRLHQQGIKIGYLEDIAKFQKLTVLNLSDNNLTDLPLPICSLKSLVELNISSNKLEEFPTQIANLSKIEAIYAHNNHLSTLPESMAGLSSLSMLVLAFNHFLEVPPILGIMAKFNENIVMSGNRISSITERLAEQLKTTKRIDFRMNQIAMNASSCINLNKFQHLSHLDLRDNLIDELDIRNLRCLEYINCDRNRITSLKLNGTSLRTLMAEENKIQFLDISPKPEYLEYLNVSRNRLGKLPEYIGECFFMTQLHAAHNILTQLPSQLFSGVGKRLRILRVNHNAIHKLPDEITFSHLEEIYLHNNWINQLPENFLLEMPKLKILNLTKNRLVVLPPLNANVDLNKVQELNLSFNFLEDSVMEVISGYKRLKILRISYNKLTRIKNEHIEDLRFLIELNVSGNSLVSLPAQLLNLQHLSTLRAHSNMLRDIPPLQKMMKLRILDLGCNELLAGSVKDLMESKLSLLDLSCNERMGLSMQELSTIRSRKRISTVMAGEDQSMVMNKTALNPQLKQTNFPFVFGLAETSGIRNKLCISVIKKMPCPTPDSGLFAMFDGGHNNVVPRILQANFIRLFIEQARLGPTEQMTMKYTMLACHRRLLQHGQKLGASSAVVYLKKKNSSGKETWQMYVANVGDVEVVVNQKGKPLRVTRLFTPTADKDEADRVSQSDGIITDDGKVNGCSNCTRILGNSFLFPQVIPDPQVSHMVLSNTDEFIIIGNKHFWNFVRYDEAVEEAQKHTHPVVAAKRLMDLAQAYGSQENISVLVINHKVSGNLDSTAIPRIGKEIGHEIIEVESESDEYSKAYSVTSSQASIESETSEGWMKKRLEGYQRLRGQKTVEEVEWELNGAVGQRMFVKRHEAEKMRNRLLQDRLSGEVKRHELEYDLQEVINSPESDAEKQQEQKSNNWKTAKINPHNKVSNYLSNTYKSMTKGPLPKRPVREVEELSEITDSDLVYNPPRADRIGDASLEPDIDNPNSNLDDFVEDPDYDFLDIGNQDVMDRPPTSVPWQRLNTTEYETIREGSGGSDHPSISTIKSTNERMKEDVYLFEEEITTTPRIYSTEGYYSEITKAKPKSKAPDLPARYLQGKPNASLSQEPTDSLKEGLAFEDQEMVAEIRSEFSCSVFSSVAQVSEDTYF